MQKSSSKTLALAGALALGLTMALAGLADSAQARGGGGGGGAGGATSSVDVSLPTDRGGPPPTGGRGVITYVNEFPDEDRPIIVIPFPRFGRGAPSAAPGYQEACFQDQYRPDRRVVCERIRLR